MSLFDILGTTDPNVVTAYLRESYINAPSETARQAHAQMLDEFFKGGGDAEMRRVIALLWKDAKNQERRLAVLSAGLDKADNVIARIAQEKATVYNEPAQRKVSNETNASYQALLTVLPMDEIMRAADEMLAIHEDALIGYRVRVKPTGEREPVIDVISPARFWAVAHPNDQTLLVAVIVDIRAPMAKPEDPTYRVWSDDQTFVMNSKCEIMGKPEAWPLKRMPFVLCSTRLPGAKPTLLAECPSQDLLSAQKAVRLQDLNIVKESISANKQAYVAGDTSSTPMGQSSDSDGEIMLGEGVTVTSLDRGVDPDIYHDAAERAADAASANHGVPSAVRSQKDASSGAEIEMRNLPIRALRKKRIPMFRRIEFQLAAIMSLVNGLRVTMTEGGEPQLAEGDLQAYAFNMQGWSIDFGEVQQPMTHMESLQAFEKERELGANDNYAWEMERNPDIKTLEEAKRIVDERTMRRTEYIQSQKDLMAASGALGAAQPKTPFEANRGERQDETEEDDWSAIAKEVLDATN